MEVTLHSFNLHFKLCPHSILTCGALIPKFPATFHQISNTPAEEAEQNSAFESEDTFDSHVGKVCNACHYHLRDLLHIRKFLTVDTAVLMANVVVSSRLDYCNILLFWVGKGSVAKLQKVQNAFCHFVFRLNKMSYVKPYLEKLHWLPISYHIVYKIQPPHF